MEEATPRKNLYEIPFDDWDASREQTIALQELHLQDKGIMKMPPIRPRPTSKSNPDRFESKLADLRVSRT